MSSQMPRWDPALTLIQKLCWGSLGNWTFVMFWFYWLIDSLEKCKLCIFFFFCSDLPWHFSMMMRWCCFEEPSTHRLGSCSPHCSETYGAALFGYLNFIFHIYVNILLKSELLCTASCFWLWQKSFGIVIACPSKWDLPQPVMEMFGFNPLVALLIKKKALIRHWQRSESCEGPGASV